ncbi:MAG TPA: serine hydrolase [Gaiellales bacterium]|nr:serine hydrolase [Gaiellales bacterium]
MALTLTAPLAYEANPGIVKGVAPPGTTSLRVLADGHSVRVLRLTSGRRAFLFGPIGLPPRDLTLRVEALAGARVLSSATVEHVFGLPAEDTKVAPPRTVDGAVQHAVAGLTARTGVTSAAWVRDLASGRTAGYNAGARFPAASTIKLGILLGVLAREDSDPLRSSSWSLERSLVLDSSNIAANALLPRAGGPATVDALIRGLGGTATFTCCDYLLEPGERRHMTERALRRPLPPTTVIDQPTFPCCKYTTAHDLGTILVSLMLASSGHGPALRLGITAREARVALWLLIHTGYPGLVRPNSPFPVGHKAGWLPNMQHDAALVFTPHGTLVAVFMNYSPGGVSYPRVREAARTVLRLALRRRG